MVWILLKLPENKIQVKNKTMKKSGATSRRKSYSQIMESKKGKNLTLSKKKLLPSFKKSKLY